MVNWCVSLRTSAHTGVAIPFDIAILSTMGIATSHGFLAMTQVRLHHRFPGSFLIICLSPFGNEKSPCSPKGTRTENTVSAVPPCLPVKPTALSAPTRRVPCNAGNASEDTKEIFPFPLPSAAHLLLRFSLPSQLWETLCGCACSFTSASKVCFIRLKSLYTMGSHLSSTFFMGCGQMYTIKNQLTVDR